MNQPLEISRLESSDIKEAATVIADAFLDNPGEHTKAVWKGSQKTIYKQHVKLFQLLLNSQGKEAYVIKQNSKIVGVYSIHHSQYCHLPILQKAKLLIPMFKATGLNFPRLIHWHNQWGHYDSSIPHMHLSPMCVAPNAQGKGVGKTMLKHLCALLDERNIGGYLETGKQSNVQFYQCFGYVVEHEIDVYGVKTWSMWRSPQEVAEQS